MKRTRTVPLAPLRLRAELAPSETGKRRAQATIYTGAEMERFDLFDGHYTLRLAMDGADLSRFNAGAPVTRNHSGDLDDVVGVTERAWVAHGVAHATLRLSDREDLAPLWADLKSGVIRNVSMDVALLELEDVSKRAGKKALLATKWQAISLAIVPAGADPGAQMAALAAGPEQPCRFIHDGGKTMRKRRKCPECKTSLAADTDETTCPNEECGIDFEEFDARRDELARLGRIHELGTHFELGDVWAQHHIKLGSTVKDAITDARRIMAEKAPVIDGRNFAAGADHDSIGSRLEQMSDALAARGRRVAPTERGRRYAHASIVECAFELIRARGLAGGLDVRAHRGRIVELAHGTSDFPLLLANVLNKMMLPAYELAQPTYRLVAARKLFKDFRPAHFLRRGEFSVPMRVGEGGEITSGTIGESDETVTVATYGRILPILRTVFVNDDVGAFNDLALAAAQRVADFENSLFFTLCILPAAGLGPNLRDGVAVYNSAHGNVTAAGVLSLTTLGEGRSLMMRQRGIESATGAADGVFLNVQPRFLLVSPTSLTLGEQLTTQITPAVVEEVNPFSSRLVAIGDANLGASTRFYMLADPARLPQYVYGHLDGFDGPRVAVREGWEVEATEIKVVTDFGVGVVDSKAGVTGAGA